MLITVALSAVKPAGGNCPVGTFKDVDGSLTATVKCFGSCPCPSKEAARFGSITNGYHRRNKSIDCSWAITSPGSHISVSFSSFDTEEDSDFVSIYSCSSFTGPDDKICVSSFELGRLSGKVLASRSWTSTTGYIFVRFTAVSGGKQYWERSFVGYWQVQQPGCVSCPTGTWTSQPSATACISCAAGYYNGTKDTEESSIQDGGFRACVACAAGKFKAETGEGNCRSCPSGESYSGSSWGCL